ncbi:SulP family inorganic anion transporter [Ponticaulis profundi]|uniref:SulP family inorganic anion transporter n=1 Tax=Ponticaulis profundi TaxID=2665222 RepID=A0ABW1S8F8_9PROT
MRILERYFPILEWGKAYNGQTLTSDVVAALIVTVMLVPQSLAYAMLAGLPPEIGLYASILPLLAYAIFGTSRTMSVGPVALLALMTAVAAGRVAEAGTPEYIAAALALAFLSGAILLVMGILRLGFLANFLSHPVVSSFVTASGILIAVSQLRHILGVEASGHNLPGILTSIVGHISDINLPTVGIGIAALALLYGLRFATKPFLKRMGLPATLAGVISKTGPVLVVLAGILIVQVCGLHERGVRIVGEIPRGLPPISVPEFDLTLWRRLLESAALIAVIGFVESIAIAQTLAAKRRQRIEPDQELIGLGMSNLAAGFSGGFPVTGGFARSAVNFDAGAATPTAGAFTALGLALATQFLTPFLFYLPQAVLAATIIVAVISLIDLRTLCQAWGYSKTDFLAMTTTIVVTLAFGVELGVSTGVGLSILLHLYNTSRPHFAFVGQVPGTQHFRNVNRHAVVVPEHILTIRVDESLYFANARFLEDTVYNVLASRPDLKHLILMCPAVNRIDMSGLESLEAINERLMEAGVTLHLSEVKGPVMDGLRRTHFLEALSGQVFLHQYEAMETLAPDCAHAATAGTAVTTQPQAEPCPSQTIAGVKRQGGR